MKVMNQVKLTLLVIEINVDDWSMVDGNSWLAHRRAGLIQWQRLDSWSRQGEGLFQFFQHYNNIIHCVFLAFVCTARTSN